MSKFGNIIIGGLCTYLGIITTSALFKGENKEENEIKAHREYLRIIYNEEKYGKMPISGHAVVSLKNAAASTMKYPKGGSDSDPTSLLAPSSSSTAATNHSTPNNTPIRSVNGTLRSLSSVVMQEIADAYSNKDSSQLFYQKLNSWCNNSQRANSTTTATDILLSYPKNKDQFTSKEKQNYVGKNNGHSNDNDLNEYHLLHQKRTKLRHQVKSLIQENNKDSYYKDVMLYDMSDT